LVNRCYERKKERIEPNPMPSTIPSALDFECHLLEISRSLGSKCAAIRKSLISHVQPLRLRAEPSAFAEISARSQARDASSVAIEMNGRSYAPAAVGATESRYLSCGYLERAP
jgi:hypothetical protein